MAAVEFVLFPTLIYMYASCKFRLVLRLIGNPASSFVCFNLVIVPALRKMSGWAEPSLRRINVTLTKVGLF